MTITKVEPIPATVSAYIIDPWECEVYGAVLPFNGDHRKLNRAVYQAMSTHGISVTAFDIVRMPHGDGLHVDDEGMIRAEKSATFRIDNYHHTLHGIGVVIGSNEETGDTKSKPAMSIEKLRSMVAFEVSRVAQAVGRAQAAEGRSVH